MSYTMTENFLSLIELIGEQDQVVRKQNDIIAKLINENLEKENMINVMMQEHVD